MKILIYRYSPRVVMLNYIANDKDVLVIAPIFQKEKYEKFSENGYKLPRIHFIEDFTLPNIIGFLEEVKQKSEIINISTLSEPDMDWVGMLNDYYVKKNSSYVLGKIFKDKYFMRSFLNNIIA